MSESNVELGEAGEIHYVYSDQGFLLGQNNISSELSDIICDDGTRAILVDGQYYVTENQAIVLQQQQEETDSNFTQYYFDSATGEFIVDDSNGDIPVNQFIENSQIVQLVEEDANDDHSPPIIFYTNDDEDAKSVDHLQAIETIPSEILESCDDGEEVEGVQDEHGNIYPIKRIKLEPDLFEIHENFIGETSDDQNSVEYTILEQPYEISEDSGLVSEEVESHHPEIKVDLSKITGRNLITGQTVTLHSYMEKLKRKLKTNISSFMKNSASVKNIEENYEGSGEGDLDELLDKKISIGKTKSGKKIVGKIVHVEKKAAVEENACDEREDSILESDPPEEELHEEQDVPTHEEPVKILVKKSTVTKDSFEEISKTLGGVMEMGTVQKKLENKNIVVKLVEKRYIAETDSVIKTTAYSYGYMEKEVIVDDSSAEKWKFIPDQNTQDALLVDPASNSPPKKTKFAITTSLTIVISYMKNGTKSIRVNLNPAPGNLCSICAQFFKTNLQLRLHMDSVHNTYGNNSQCEVCNETFIDPERLESHRNQHIADGKLFVCFECKKSFTTQNRLQKHLAIHDICARPLVCSLCDARCASEHALKKHLLTHTGIKPFHCDMCNKHFASEYDVNLHKKVHFPEKHFACNVCMRTFSRHSNLLRHTEIHKGTGANYKCDICSCSYNYISSLTRHMVQNHLDATDFKKKVKRSSESLPLTQN